MANNNSSDQKQPKAKKKTGENKFVLFFQRIGKGCKGLISELKKVTWPKFGTVVKQTGVVLVVVLVFLVIVTGIDSGLNALLQLIK